MLKLYSVLVLLLLLIKIIQLEIANGATIRKAVQYYAKREIDQRFKLLVYNTITMPTVCKWNQDIAAVSKLNAKNRCSNRMGYDQK